jgi:copper chaperone CopZ
MNQKVTLSILAATSVFLVGCGTTEAEKAEIARKNSLSAAIVRALPDSGAYQRSIAAKESESRNKVIQNIKNVPAWFLTDETNEDATIVTAVESSPDMQLSIDMAMLSAKRLLTSSLGEKISSQMTEFGGQTSGTEGDAVLNKEVERITKTVVADVLLKGYQRDRIEVVANGKEFQTYVRLRYPTAELKKALAAELNKSNLMAAKVRRTKAFEELEKEIEGARNSK